MSERANEQVRMYSRVLREEQMEEKEAKRNERDTQSLYQIRIHEDVATHHHQQQQQQKTRKLEQKH